MLYRLKTYAGGPLYAARIPEIPKAIKWTPAKGPETLFQRSDAAEIKRRLSKKPLRMKVKMEAA